MTNNKIIKTTKDFQTTNGNYLVKGIDLTEEQKSLLNFNGMSDNNWIRCHSFWFKDGKPSTEQGYYYPVCTYSSFLPY